MNIHIHINLWHKVEGGSMWKKRIKRASKEQGILMED